jgi:superfamily II DNA/RNA helicase
LSEHFSKLGLSQSVVNAVSDAGYSEPTDIQQKAIPHILEKRDIVGIAQTGTGKTASFVLPMLTLLEKGRARARMPRTLILEPTRELAAQVHENFEKYGKNHKLTVALLIGGVSFEEQNKKLDRGADVLIATPGRLLDHFERGRLLMTGVDIFVIDEADRMLDMGFVPDIERVSALLPKRRQTLLFSATMPDEIAKLTSKFLTNPERVEVARQNSTAETITQKAVKVGSKPFEKRAALRAQINAAKDLNNAIIFCNRKRDIATLTRSLERHGFNAGALHGDMDQKSRMATLDGFKAGSIKILVASDVAARGLDIPEVSHVYNFDVPTHAEDYVHRIGRTGRAGRSGQAVSLVTKADEKYLSAIEKLIEKSIEVEEAPKDATSEAKTEKPRSENQKRSRGPKKQAPDNAEKNQQSASTESQKSSKNNRKKRSGNDNQDRVPFGQSDQVPAFLLRPVRRAS